MNKRFISLCCCTIILVCSVYAQGQETLNTGYAQKGWVSDLLLIYNGGAHRSNVWDEEKFESCVYAKDKNGKYGWLFDSFLFLEIHDGTNSFASGYKPTPARKDHWMGLMNTNLMNGYGINALNSCIEKAKKICKDPFKKRKLVMSLPEPIPNQKNWGSVNGKKLDFSKSEDRIEAVKWYIDYVEQRLKQEKLKNVELEGFYWLAEEATNSRKIVNQIADYIRSKGYHFYWIPYFNTDGRDEWKQLGFDQAFLQPNHFFNNDIPDSRIDEACSIAKRQGMSLEMEFDENAAEKSGNKGNRMKAYIDGFTRNNVWDTSDVAYYQGGIGLYVLKNGTEKDKELYNELANIIIERQRKRNK